MGLTKTKWDATENKKMSNKNRVLKKKHGTRRIRVLMLFTTQNILWIFISICIRKGGKKKKKSRWNAYRIRITKTFASSCKLERKKGKKAATKNYD